MIDLVIRSKNFQGALVKLIELVAIWKMRVTLFEDKRTERFLPELKKMHKVVDLIIRCTSLSKNLSRMA